MTTPTAKTAARVLVVEDEDRMRSAISRFLSSNGHEVAGAESCKRAEQLFRSSNPDVVITDFLLPDGEAPELIRTFRKMDATVPVLVLTGHNRVDLAVKSVKEGAEDFLTKPVDLSMLLEVLRKAVDRRKRNKRVASTRGGSDLYIGRSTAVRQMWDQLESIAEADCPVLLLGETGTGKSLLARWLHENGARASGPFVDLNCAALPRELVDAELFGYERGAFTGAQATKVGLFEAAHRGTLFLDEIGDIDVSIQPKILKVLEDRRYRRVGDVRERTADVRLISATHQDLGRAVNDKQFRADLYFRISTVTVTVPPLRERTEDIPGLATHFLERLGERTKRVHTLAQDAEEVLLEHSWPGNLRELNNVLERAMLTATRGVITAADLRFDSVTSGVFEAPASSSSNMIAATPSGSHRTMREIEKETIEAALREEGGRVEAAARRLGIPRSTMYQRLKAYGIATPRRQSNSSIPAVKR